MQLSLYQVDAFTDGPFSGNPAAVVPLSQWLSEPTMQAIALENNLSETAFFVPRDDGGFDLRWFTPADRGRSLRSRHAGYRLGPVQSAGAMPATASPSIPEAGD